MFDWKLRKEGSHGQENQVQPIIQSLARKIPPDATSILKGISTMLLHLCPCDYIAAPFNISIPATEQTSR